MFENNILTVVGIVCIGIVFIVLLILIGCVVAEVLRKYIETRHEESKEYKHLLKITLVGSEGCGKTSIVERLINDRFLLKYTPTVCVDLETYKLTVRSDPIKLQLWDTSGMTRFNHISSCYLRRTHCAMIIFDLTDRSSFESIEKWFNDAQSYSNPTIVLVGTKCDLESNVSQEEITKWCDTRNIAYYKVSSADNLSFDDPDFYQINDLFEKIAEKMIDNGNFQMAIDMPHPKFQKS